MHMPTELVRDPREWQRRCWGAREGGRWLALVPTMGFLHEGHLSLLREARRRADASSGSDTGGAPPAGRPLALATIFVNPAQFGPAEDLSRYPRDLEGDLAKCSEAGIDWALAPESSGEVYAGDHQTWIEVERVSRGLCGEKRPGHFRGVATVVAKLFNLTRPHLALFGEKDWQQLQVIRALVSDLDFGVEVLGMPIVRERDGLAFSSRNAYLSADERRRALALSLALFQAQERAAAGERDATALAEGATRSLLAAGARVDYVEVVHPTKLTRVARAETGSRMLVAAFVGATRLIDNVALP
jgi:pantoate--beta-alanine ligase